MQSAGLEVQGYFLLVMSLPRGPPWLPAGTLNVCMLPQPCKLRMLRQSSRLRMLLVKQVQDAATAKQAQDAVTAKLASWPALPP